MSIRVITVSREYASGGHEVAQMVAERLGYDYYDRALVSKIAKESGLAEDYIIEQGEYASSRVSFLFSLSVGASASSGGSSPSDQLYVIQHNIIEKLAEEHRCVIVGRCADYILADRADCLHVFFEADEKDKIARLNEREEHSNPAKRLKERDDKRRVYYKHYTGRDWGRSKNYDLVLNTSKISLSQCADIIVSIVKASEEK